MKTPKAICSIFSDIAKISYICISVAQDNPVLVKDVMYTILHKHIGQLAKFHPILGAGSIHFSRINVLITNLLCILLYVAHYVAYNA